MGKRVVSNKVTLDDKSLSIYFTYFEIMSNKFNIVSEYVFIRSKFLILILELIINISVNDFSFIDYFLFHEIYYLLYISSINLL